MMDDSNEERSGHPVKLPFALRNFFNEKGYAASNIFENRTTARLKIRCEAVLHLTVTPAFLARSELDFQVLVKDMSKTGIGILCHRQLYPTESFCIELMGRQIHAAVVRCRKLGESCYEVGARISTVATEDTEE